MAVHNATINATPLQKAVRYVGRISRIYQAIAQKGHSCPVEDLYAELTYLEGELIKMKLPAPKSHQEAAALWAQWDSENAHALNAVAHDEYGNQIDPNYPGLKATIEKLAEKG